MKEHELTMLLRPVRRRLTAFTVSRWALIGLLGGSMAGAALLAASRLWPLLHIRTFAAIAVCAGLAAGFALGWRKRASLRDTARTMDKADTEDAIGTALDGLALGGEEQPIVRLQREEAVAAAANYTSQLRTKLPWPRWERWRKLVYGVAAVWAVAAALLAWPNPLDEKAEALAQARSKLAELKREAEKLAEQADAAKLPEEAKRELLEPLEQLRSKLDALSGDSLAALEQLEAALRELEKTVEGAKQAAERLEEAAKTMSGEQSLRQLGQALQDRDAAGMSKAIDELRSELHRLTLEEREAIAEALERTSAGQPDSEAASKLADALKQAAEQARSGAADESGSDGLDALEQALASELSQQQLEELARSMAEQLGAAGQSLASQAAAAGQSVPSAWAGGAAGGGTRGSASGGGSGQGGPSSGETSGGAGTNPGTGTGSEAGQGEGAGAGQGSGAGAGTGSGSGAGAGTGSGSGSGAGSGSGSGSGSGQGSGSGSGSGQGAGAGMGAGGRTLVTTPRNMAGTGNIQQDGGPSTGGQTQTGGQSPMLDGMTRPYEEVYNEYAAEAKQSLERSELPAGMQEKVKQYFEQIQPNR